MKRIVILLILILYYAGEILGRNFALVNYNADNGLSHNTVTSIAQDQYGFMWFGTADGVNRFDGINFRAYYSDNQSQHKLMNTFVYSLCVDRKNVLWVGTENGLYLYDENKDTFSHFNFRTQYGVVVTGRITSIYENKDGRIWIGTEAQGFFIYYPEERLLVQNSRLSDAVTDISGGSDSNVFLSTSSGIVAEFDSEGSQLFSTQTKTIDDHVPVIKSLCYNNDELWVCFETAGVAKMIWRENKYSEWTAQQDFSAYKLLPLSRGELLVGSDEGLSIFYPTTGRTEPVSDMSVRNDIYTQVVNTLFRDSEGGVWAATQNNGITYLPRRLKPIEHMVRETGKNDKILVTSFTEDERGNLWLGIDKYGIMKMGTDGRLDTNPIHNASRSFLREIRNVKTLLADNNLLWIGTYSGGVYSWDMKRGSISNYRNDPAESSSLCDDNILTLFKDFNGNIYAGTPWGFSKYDREKDSFVRINKGGNDLYVCGFFQAEPGQIWVLSRNKGSFLYNMETGEFNHYPFDGKGKLKSVCTLVDSKGNTWLGTETGLYRLDQGKKRFVLYNALDNRLQGVGVASLEEDSDGMLWISSNNGLFCLDTEIHEIRYHLTVNDGLVSNQFNSRASLHGQDGKLYFSGISGYSSFYPKTLQRNNFVPPVQLTGLFINDRPMEINQGGKDTSPLQKPLHLSDNLQMKSNQNSVGFTFAVLSYQSPTKNRYAYRLIGYEKEWNYTNKGEVHYSSLSPGKYSFIVKGTNDDGLWSETQARIDFVVSYPFYLSPLAIVVYILVVALILYLIFLYVRYRHRQKMAEFASLQENLSYQSKIDFFTNVAHEIRTPLSLIKVPLESILKSDEKFLPKTSEYLHVMGKNLDNLLNMVNQLLDLRKAETTNYTLTKVKCNISEMIGDLCLHFSSAAEVMGKTLEMQIKPDVMAEINHDAISKIVNNLLSNALKYSNDKISVSLISNETIFRIMVADDGKGVVSEDMERIFDTFYQSDNSKGGTGIGLTLARMLAVKHGGSLVLDNTSGEGTVFTVEVPLNADLPYVEEKLRAEDEYVADSELINYSLEDEETPKVLVVEDNDDLRTMITGIIGAKYEVVAAANGIEALDMLAENNCSLIVSDIMMPEMDGYQLCEHVKSDIKYCHIPIIQLTAKTSLEDKVRGLEHGAEAYIEKPFSADHLMAQIESLIKNRERIRIALLSGNVTEREMLGISKRDAEFIKKLNKNIEEHISEQNFYIEQLAEEMNMSRSNFYRKVKGLFGVSPNDYMKTYRLRKAVELILSGEYIIKEIYEQVGFKTSSYFSVCFREEYGMTPKQYMDAHITK